MDGREGGRDGVSRRDFLKVAGLLGAAAAGARTVLRARDVRADPDPPSGDADVVFIHSTCQMCDSGCGLKAKVRRGQLLKLDGSPYHPHNRGEDERVPFARTPVESRAQFGSFCARGHAGVQALYDPQRVQHPLKRVGPRGSGRWEVVTWAQAFAEIGARINALIPFDERLTRDIDPAAPDLGKIANQLVFAPGRSVEPALAARLFQSGYGTVNHALDEASLREGSRRAGHALMTRDHVTGAPGVERFAPDLDRAAYVLVFGADPVASSPPLLARKLAALRDPARPGGAGRVVVVDPRLSHSAAKADQWVAVKPGGDAALALGIARVMLAEGRYNTAYLARANRGAAAGDGCYTDATWLVIVEPGHRREGQWLTPAEAGLSAVIDARHPVCVRAADGVVVEVPLNAAAPPVVGRLEPVDAGRDIVTVNGLRCRSAFAVYRAAVFEHGLAEYAALSGVDAAVITRLAMDFTAQGRRASAWAGGGATQGTRGTYTQLAVMALNWMVGNVDAAGGLMRGGGGWSERRAAGGVDTDAVAGAARPTGPRIDRAGAEYTAEKSYFTGYPAPRAWFPLAPGGAHQELVPSIAQGYPYPIKVLITSGSDWPYAVPGGKAVWERAVADETALPLLVAISTVLGEAATWADYVLPDTTHLERWGFPEVSTAVAAQATSLQQPVVGAYDSVTLGGDGRWSFDPTARNEYAPLLPDTKMHGDILIGLAKAISSRFPGVGVNGFGPGLPLDRAWDFYRHQVANVARNVGPSLTGAALTAADIVARGGAFAAPGSGYDPTNPALLARRHGSVLHFYAPELAATVHAITGRRFRGVAHHDGVRRLDGGLVRDGAFPLQLVTYTPASRAREHVGAGAWLAGLQPANRVEMTEPDARAAGVETGDRVRISSASNPVGVVGVAKVIRGLRPGVVAVALGFGRWEGGARSHLVNGRATAYDPVRGAGVNPAPVMRLDDTMGDVSLQDPVGGGCSFSDTWVRVEPVAAR